MRKFTSQSLIFDATVTLRVAAKNGRTTAIVCTFLHAKQRTSLASQSENGTLFYTVGPEHISFINDYSHIPSESRY